MFLLAKRFMKRLTLSLQSYLLMQWEDLIDTYSSQVTTGESQWVYVYWAFRSFTVKWPFKFFCSLFFYWIICHLLSDLSESTYFWYKTFHCIYIIFYVVCLFTLLMVSFDKQKFFVLHIPSPVFPLWLMFFGMCTI